MGLRAVLGRQGYGRNELVSRLSDGDEHRQERPLGRHRPFPTIRHGVSVNGNLYNAGGHPLGRDGAWLPFAFWLSGRGFSAANSTKGVYVSWYRTHKLGPEPLRPSCAV